MKRILLVDDDPHLTESAKDILEDAGYGVEIAATLADARRILSSQALDILVTDFNLPDGKGPALAQEVKMQQPLLKRILMTGEAVNHLSAGERLFDAILSKPVDPAAFLALLERLDTTPEASS